MEEKTNRRPGRAAGTAEQRRAVQELAQSGEAQKLLSMLPPEIQAGYEPLLLETDDAVRQIVKAADKLSAYIKCVEELKAGNQEFATAAAQTREALEQMDLPCLRYFMEHCLPSFAETLDQLQGGT